MKIESREELLERLLDPELTLTETAKILEVCPATVRRYADKGALPHHRTPGNQRRFKLRDVLGFLERKDRSGIEDIGDVEPGLS
jgi:excisionase family DNA binding protein